MTRAASASELYLDTSCLLKLLFREPESEEVAALVGRESRVVVSDLARLEAETQLRERRLGGLLTRARHERLASAMSSLLRMDPFAFMLFPEDGFDRARTLASRVKVHCRTLDLLHLAAMNAARVDRLLTNDTAQAGAARDLGCSVMVPGRPR